MLELSFDEVSINTSLTLKTRRWKENCVGKIYLAEKNNKHLIYEKYIR